MGQAFWTGVRLPSSPPESSGTVKNDLHFSQSLFCAFFFEMTVMAHLYCHLERSRMGTWGRRHLSSTETISREISHHNGASSLQREISPLRFGRNDKEAGRALISIRPL